MRKISATYIFPGNRPPLKNGILLCEENGTIVDIIETSGIVREQERLEYYSGILVPGFVNTHCHLELSHLKGKIAENSGLGNFLSEIHRLRNKETEPDESALARADFQMEQNGTVVVGDISNSTATLEIKRKSKLYYHTFAEAFGFHPSRANKSFQIAEFIEELFLRAGLSASVTPHAPYSVSETLFQKLKVKAQTSNGILSIHNQESQDEEKLFKSCSGPIWHHLNQTLGLDLSHWKSRQENVLKLILPFLPISNPLLLVHNTYTMIDDITEVKTHRNQENTFFVLCPNSNLYIEGRLPQVPLFKQKNLNLCLGTDSLASNHQLSILQEMVTLQKHFPEITIQELIEWACLNGARALRAEHRYGSFEKGKRPGINLITGVDLQRLKLTPASRVKVLA